MVQYIRLTDGNGAGTLVPITERDPPNFESLSPQHTTYGDLYKEPAGIRTIVRVPCNSEDHLIFKVREPVDEIAQIIHNPARPLH